MKRLMWTLGVICLAGSSALAADKPPTTGQGDIRAAALMEEAANTRYTWSPDVTVVSGKFTWEMGSKSGAGTFKSVLHQRGGLTIESADKTDIPEDVKDHITSMINHRVSPSSAAAKRPTPASVIVIEDEDRGPLIMTVGDPMQSTQRVKDGRLVQVNRLMGGKRFTIDVTEFERSPDSHWYPAAFKVTWWDAATGKKLETQVYTTQGFSVIDGQMFPKAEKVVSEKHGKTSNLQLNYSEVKFVLSHQRAVGK